MKMGLVCACAVAMAFSGCEEHQTPGEALATNEGPVKVGEEIPVFLRSPSVTTQPSNSQDKPSLVWRETIHQPEATYIAIHFSRFSLPDGAHLVVRDAENTRSKAYRGDGKVIGGKALADFWGQHVVGSEAIIELYANRDLEEGLVTIDKIARGLPAFNDLAADMVIGPESICGSDDSEWAKCYENEEAVAYNRSRAVARLLINGSGGCTGWLVGDEGHLMTNHHCISTESQAANTNYEFMAEGATCTTDCASGGACAGTIEADGATLIRANAALDYALVKLPENISSTYGYLQMRSTGAVVDERIYIPQHPARWGKRIAMYSTADGDNGVCRVVSLNESGCAGRTGNDEVGYFCDTRGGSSGSPVLGYHDNLVVALHHCGNCENRAIPIDKVIDDLGTNLPSNSVSNGGGGDTEPPVVSFEAPSNGDTVRSVVTLRAFAEDNVGVSQVSFYVDGTNVGNAFAAPYSMEWDSTTVANGSYALEAVAVDAANNSATTQVTVTIENEQGANLARYDASLGAPACHAVQASCDSGSLLVGRGNLSGGTEANAPNTLHGTCSDGSSGSYQDDESLERIRITNTKNKPIAAGDTVTVSADVWVWNASPDHLDLYYTNDATAANPEWSFLATLEPSAAGLQTLSTTYVVPQGSLQAIRGNFRYQGQASSCGTGNYDDTDDLVFAVDSTTTECTPIYATDFEGGNGGWAMSEADSTCSTGNWIDGNPEGVTAGDGTVTQPEDDHTELGERAFFTAHNTAVGTDDVDGGVCVALSPSIDASAYQKAEISLWYFHGQRDQGDDDGDFVAIDVSKDNGVTYTETMFRAGDVTSNANWQRVSAVIDNPGQLRIRLQAADGASMGDLVEMGIDDVHICGR